MRERTHIEPDVLTGLGTCGVATVHEAQGRTGLMHPGMRPIFRGARVAGRAVTVSIPPCDNWTIHLAIEKCSPGDIMVVAPETASHAGYFGELLACAFEARGIAALVIDAGVRDVRELTEMGYPVWSTAISAQGTIKKSIDSINVPITCAGAIVTPGDAIVADDDGVCVVPSASADQVLVLSRQREDKEEKLRARLKSGELSADVFGLRP